MREIKYLVVLYILLSAIYYSLLSLYIVPALPLSGRAPPGVYLLFYILIFFLFIYAFLCLPIVFGLMRRWHWTRKLGLFISLPPAIILTFMGGFAVVEIIFTWESYKRTGDPSALASWWALFLSIGIINLLCVYYLTRSQVKTHLSREKSE